MTSSTHRCEGTERLPMLDDALCLLLAQTVEARQHLEVARVEHVQRVVFERLACGWVDCNNSVQQRRRLPLSRALLGLDRVKRCVDVVLHQMKLM